MRQRYQSFGSSRNFVRWHNRVLLHRKANFLSVVFLTECRSLLSWRRHLAASLFKAEKKVALVPESDGKIDENAIEKKDDPEEEDLDQDIEEQLLLLNEQQRKEAKRFSSLRKFLEAKIKLFFIWFRLKRKRKHVMKEKRKLRDRLALKMVLPGDVHDIETAEGGRNDQGLFNLEKIKTRKVR